MWGKAGYRCAGAAVAEGAATTSLQAVQVASSASPSCMSHTLLRLHAGTSLVNLPTGDAAHDV